MTKQAILINLDRCTGCWTCSMACKVGNRLADEVWWQTVRTLGSGEGIDRPSGVWPNLKMSWLPIHSKECVMCAGRTAEGKEPYCVHNCPTEAMHYGDIDDESSLISQKVEELRERDFRIFKLPSWENSHDSIVYASKRS